MSKLKFKECEDCEEWNGSRLNCANICMKPFEAMDEFDEYKTLEEQGMLIKLPCKVGEEVWGISTQHDNYDESPYKIVSRTTFRLDMLGCVGKTVFLTKEAAEAALKEINKNKGE